MVTALGHGQVTGGDSWQAEVIRDKQADILFCRRDHRGLALELEPHFPLVHSPSYGQVWRGLGRHGGQLATLIRQYGCWSWWCPFPAFHDDKGQWAAFSSFLCYSLSCDVDARLCELCRDVTGNL